MANCDRVADVYFRRHDVPETQDACRTRIHWLCAQAAGRRVLDIGCSQGISALILGREGHEVVGLDIEPEPLAAARAALAREPAQVQERVQFVLGDAFTAEFEPGSFDTVILGEILEHLVSPERLLERVGTWLVDGGRVVVSVPHGHHPYHDHKRSFYLSSLVSLLNRQFSIATVEVLAGRFLGAVARKPPAGQAPATPAVAELLAWQRACDDNLEGVQRRGYAERQELSARCEDARESIARLKRSEEELRRQVQGTRADLARVQADLAAAQAQRTRLEEELRGATQRAQEAGRRAAQLEEGAQKHARALREQERKLAGLQEQQAAERQRRRQAEARLERLEAQLAQARAELTLRAQEVRYRLGDAFVRAATSPRDLVKLPVRVLRLLGEGLRRRRARRAGPAGATAAPAPAGAAAPQAAPRSPAPSGPGAGNSGPADGDAADLLGSIPALAEPFSSAPPELRRRSDLRLAAVCDEFSWRGWQYEADLCTFTPQSWREVLEERPPALLLVESTWSGLHDSWYFQVRDLGQRGEVIKYYALPDVVAWCRARGIPAVFYNKEDPPNFDVFLEAARLFDWVFTSDANCIPDYRKHLGHERIAALPFAAQPRIHNPVMTGTRTGAVCFAGTWYAHRHFDRQGDAEKILRPALDFDLHIFDRMARSDNPNYRWPEAFLPAVRGALPYAQMLAAYKRYKVFLNINSVTNSPTMFARRVFELLACGTPVISAYALGIERLLGRDVVLLSESAAQTRELLERVLGDEVYRERLALRGQRKVFSAHTCTHRLQTVLDTVGLKLPPVARPVLTMLAAVEDPPQAAAAWESFRRQRYEARRLVLCATGPEAAAAAERVAGGAAAVRIVAAGGATWGAALAEALRDTAPGYVAALHPGHYYGPDYLTDYAHATLYVTEPALGKASFYQLAPGGGLRVVNPGCEYRVTGKLNPWTACLPAAAAQAAAARLTSARTPLEWWSRLLRPLERVYASDRFNYVQPAPVADGLDAPAAAAVALAADDARATEPALA